MARFLTPLDVELAPNSDCIWIVKSPLIYQSNIISSNCGYIKVPTGFQSDLASVPRLPIIYSLFGDRCHREAIIHDWLYRINSTPCVSFMDANKVFLEAMTIRGKSDLVRYGMYFGVCAGGYLSYHKKYIEDKLC